MSDAKLEESLARLTKVLHRLNEVSDNLNVTITDFEDKLLELSPGISVWSLTPLQLLEGAHWGSLLGFAKHEDRWGLWVRRGRVQATNGGWEPDPHAGFKISLLKLIDATREERAAAIEQFPVLVEGMVTEAEKHVAKLARASKGPR
jgi:hypothetical protein